MKKLFIPAIATTLFLSVPMVYATNSSDGISTHPFSLFQNTPLLPPYPGYQHDEIELDFRVSQEPMDEVVANSNFDLGNIFVRGEVVIIKNLVTLGRYVYGQIVGEYNGHYSVYIDLHFGITVVIANAIGKLTEEI